MTICRILRLLLATRVSLEGIELVSLFCSCGNHLTWIVGVRARAEGRHTAVRFEEGFRRTTSTTMAVELDFILLFQLLRLRFDLLLLLTRLWTHQQFL